MALSKLSGDAQRTIFVELCNVLDPGVAIAFASVNRELRALTLAERQQLRAHCEAAAALARKAGKRSCKALREAKVVRWYDKDLSSDDLVLLGTLGSVMPALEKLGLFEDGDFDACAAGLDGVRQLAVGLGAGALPALTALCLVGVHLGEAGASELAAALDRGAMPLLKHLTLHGCDIGDAGLVALAPALRRRPALEALDLTANYLSDEGIAALVAPPPMTGAPPTTTGVLPKLKVLNLYLNEIETAGCATLHAALDSGALPALTALEVSENYEISPSGGGVLGSEARAAGYKAYEEAYWALYEAHDYLSIDAGDEAAESDDESWKSETEPEPEAEEDDAAGPLAEAIKHAEGAVRARLRMRPRQSSRALARTSALAADFSSAAPLPLPAPSEE